MHGQPAHTDIAMRTNDARPPAQVTAFAGRLRRLHDDALLALLVTLGEQLGLFALLARMPQSSSAAIAAHAGLRERYVREWLAAMVCGQIIDYDGARDTYALPVPHAAVLCDPEHGRRARSLGAHAALVPHVEHAARVATEVPADALAALLAARAEHEAALCARTIVPNVLPALPELHAALVDGVDVLDVGASLAHVLATAFPHSRFTPREGAELEAERFDCAIGCFQLGLAPEPARLLAELRRALRPGGVLLCLEHAGSSKLSDDAQSPHATAAYAESTLLALPLAGTDSVLGSMAGDARARRLLSAAGFDQVEVRRVPGDDAHHLLISRAPR